MNDRPTILITGSALASSLGVTREQTWQAILAGQCGMRPMTAMESPLPPGRDGGQALDLPEDFFPELPREARYLKWTIDAALQDANLFPSPGTPGEGRVRVPLPPSNDAPTLQQNPHPALSRSTGRGSQTAILLGTTLHGMRAGGRFLRSNDFAELQNFLAGATLKLATQHLPFTGPAITTCSACSSSLGSIALGVTLLQTGAVDCVVAGGYDTISEYVYGGFNSLRLVAEGPLRPFTKGRQGMKLAEGYAIVVLERADDAAARGVTGQGQIRGWGESADAHHLTQPHPTGEGASRAMQAALDRAALSPASIELVSAHATGTPDNDAGEFAALSRIFGADLPRVPVVGFKSHLGHTLGGAGAVELILAMLAMRDQTVPACANVHPNEIEFPGLNVASEKSRPAKIAATLNTSLGFGGANTCMILTPPDRSQSTRGKQVAREVFITGVGVIAPGFIGKDQLCARLHAPTTLSALAGKVPEEALEGLLNARRVRRLSDYVKLQLAAATLACRDAGIAESPDLIRGSSAILGTTHGSTSYSHSYYGQIVREGVAAANPMLFAEGVPNAGAAHVSLMLGLQGACQSVIGTRTAGLDALALATLRIANGDWDRALVGAAEEDYDLIRQAYQHCGLGATAEPSPALGTDGSIFSAGAAAYVLESRAAVEARGGKPLARVDSVAMAHGGGGSFTDAALQVLNDLGRPANVLSSAAGSRLDAVEAAAIRRSGATQISTIYGYVADCFSATPLIGAAAAIFQRSLPRHLAPPIEFGSAGAADGSTAIDSFAILCSDLTGVVAGARIGIL